MKVYYIRLDWVNEDCGYWRCWLKLKDSNDDSDNIIGTIGKSPNEACWSVPNLISGFERLENEFLARNEVADFYRIFQNASLLETLEKSNRFQALWNFKPDEQKFPNLEYVLLAFFKALYSFLIHEERYRKYDANIVLVYCAWQRYNTAKKLMTTLREKQITSTIKSEFLNSYRILQDLLEQDSFSYPFYVLWCFKGGEKELSWPLVRERFRISMVLFQAEDRKAHINEEPVKAPLCFDKKINWKGIKILHRFAKESKVTVRRLIRYWLLPRYNLRDSRILATKLLCSERLYCCFFKFLIPIIYIVAFFTVLLIPSDGSIGFVQKIVSLGLHLFFPTIILVSLLYMDFFCAFEILLPRLWGAVFIGYAAFLISEEGFRLSKIICQHNSEPLVVNWFAAIGFLLFSFAFALWYFGKEAYVYTSDFKEAFKRALRVSFLSVLASLSLGIWLCQFAYYVVPPERYGKLQPVLPGALHDIPIPALLTFAPLALIIGIVVQIIWQEKPITATIWNQEER